MSSTTQRRQPRYPVNFSVRFGAAREFVQEYAENLSTGGLFVRGAHRLGEGEQVLIEIDLPGYDTFIVTARVAHVLSPEEAQESGRHPGAGLTIQNQPNGFSDAMRTYLLRLGKRRDHIVLVSDEAMREMIGEAGFQVRSVPPPNALSAVVNTVDAPVIAVVVNEQLREPYASAAEAAGLGDLIHTIASLDEFEDTLRALDRRLELHTAS